jgi:hypothetical protein
MGSRPPWRSIALPFEHLFADWKSPGHLNTVADRVDRRFLSGTRGEIGALVRVVCGQHGVCRDVSVQGNQSSILRLLTEVGQTVANQHALQVDRFQTLLDEGLVAIKNGGSEERQVPATVRLA